MIRELCKQLQEALRTAGCPFDVVEGETTTTAARSRERIVVEHDDGGDSFGAARGARANPSHRLTRSVGCRATIYAQSTRAGALDYEHRRRCEAALDALLVAIDRTAQRLRVSWSPSSGSFVKPEDQAASERRGGAVYELRFSIDRAVIEQSWAGEAAPEVELGPSGVPAVTTTRRVSIDGRNYEEF